MTKNYYRKHTKKIKDWSYQTYISYQVLTKCRATIPWHIFEFQNFHIGHSKSGTWEWIDCKKHATKQMHHLRKLMHNHKINLLLSKEFDLSRDEVRRALPFMGKWKKNLNIEELFHVWQSRTLQWRTNSSHPLYEFPRPKYLLYNDGKTKRRAQKPRVRPLNGGPWSLGPRDPQGFLSTQNSAVHIDAVLRSEKLRPGCV